MADEYISKADVIDDLHTQLMYRMGSDDMKRRLDDWVKTLPPADVASVVHGRWIKYTGMGKVQWMCSECSAEEKNPKVANYCYHCGAKMDGEREG